MAIKIIDYTKYVDMSTTRFNGMSSDSIRATLSEREHTEILFHHYAIEIAKELKPKKLFEKKGK